MRDRREFLKLMLGGAVAATTVPMAGAVLRDSASSVRGKPSLRIVHIGDPQFGFCDGAAGDGHEPQSARADGANLLRWVDGTIHGITDAMLDKPTDRPLGEMTLLFR